MKIKQLLSIGEGMLNGAGIESAKHDAGALLCFATGFDRHQILLDRDSDVDERQSELYLGLVRRRGGGEPLQYITGEQYFMGHRFAVNPSVLIPRPETEMLAEKAIAYIKARIGAGQAIRVLDLCTGSGVLAISIAKACPSVKVTASDISEQALLTAKKNALELGVQERVEFIKSDLFEAIGLGSTALPGRGAIKNKYGLIVTNPPYIRTGDLAGLQREIKDHEPLEALDGGADGLEYYRRIATDAQAHLDEKGMLMAEIGCDQAQAAACIFKIAGFAVIEIFQDLAGHDRILTACP